LALSSIQSIKQKVVDPNAVLLLPLAFITVFCFGYVLAQAKTDTSGTSASQQPSSQDHSTPKPLPMAKQEDLPKLAPEPTATDEATYGTTSASGSSTSASGVANNTPGAASTPASSAPQNTATPQPAQTNGSSSAAKQQKAQTKGLHQLLSKVLRY
jgi:hypothetical protein